MEKRINFFRFSQRNESGIEWFPYFLSSFFNIMHLSFPMLQADRAIGLYSLFCFSKPSTQKLMRAAIFG